MYCTRIILYKVRKGVFAALLAVPVGRRSRLAAARSGTAKRATEAPEASANTQSAQRGIGAGGGGDPRASTTLTVREGRGGRAEAAPAARGSAAAAGADAAEPTGAVHVRADTARALRARYVRRLALRRAERRAHAGPPARATGCTML